MATGTKSRGPKQRVFTLTVNIDGTDYRVSPLDCDPAIGSKAYRVHKLTADDKVYDLHLGQFGWVCDCPGHVHHGHCKHADVINRLCLLFNPPASEEAPF